MQKKTGWISTGMLSWLLQRLSGLFLVYALAVHLWTVHVVDSGRLNWEVITTRLQDGSSWTIYYLLFIPAVVYHAFNGMWGIVLDYDPPAVWRRPLLGLFWIMGVALLTYGYVGIRPLLGGP